MQKDKSVVKTYRTTEQTHKMAAKKLRKIKKNLGTEIKNFVKQIAES
jgi:hypothetical protein